MNTLFRSIVRCSGFAIVVGAFVISEPGMIGQPSTNLGSDQLAELQSELALLGPVCNPEQKIAELQAQLSELERTSGPVPNPEEKIAKLQAQLAALGPVANPEQKIAEWQAQLSELERTRANTIEVWK